MTSPREAPILLAVTPGDPEGIGAEIVWKTLRDPKFRKLGIRLLCFGARTPFDRLGAKIILAQDQSFFPKKEKAPFVWLREAPVKVPQAKRPNTARLAGYQSGWAIEEATRFVLAKKASALVTGPISKERLQLGGFNYSGHTEFLADLCHAGEVTMMLANSQLRVSMVTTHIGLGKVPSALTREKIRRTVQHTLDHLKYGLGIRKPRIAIAALNPHAGESGLFGSEEIQIIFPEIKALRKSLGSKCTLLGPLPADTLFAQNQNAAPKLRFDGVVCMYHDQGLIPVKLLDFAHTVNITLGLPIIRTSVDHGVAFDIAGKGIADPSSLKAAIEIAANLSKKSKAKNGVY